MHGTDGTANVWIQWGISMCVMLAVCVGVWQVAVSRRKLLRTRKRLVRTRKQLDTEVRFRRDANTPYFDLQLLVKATDVVQDNVFLVLSNWGVTPALEVEVGLVQSEAGDEQSVTQFATILAKERKAFLLTQPLRPSPLNTEIYVRYSNTAETWFYQSWVHRDGKFHTHQMPTPQDGARDVQA